MDGPRYEVNDVLLTIQDIMLGLRYKSETDSLIIVIVWMGHDKKVNDVFADYCDGMDGPRYKSERYLFADDCDGWTKIQSERRLLRL